MESKIYILQGGVKKYLANNVKARSGLDKCEIASLIWLREQNTNKLALEYSQIHEKTEV